MKKNTKIVLIILVTTTTVLLLLYAGLYLWLNLRIDKAIDEKTYHNLVEAIETSQGMPDRFYKIYGQVTEFNENSTTKKFIFNKTLTILSFDNFRKQRNPCPCVNANYEITYNSLDNWTVGLALDKDVSPKKCLDFYLSNFYFLFSVKGIQHASEFYYHKQLDQLSDEEMLELSIMTINPLFYNKIKHPERLKEKVQQIQKNK